MRALVTVMMPAILCLGQTPAKAPAAAAQGLGPMAAPGLLRIIVLVGEGAVNRIPLRLVTDPVVEVRDKEDLPVEGVTVVFTLPETGPGGSYGGERVYTAKTDANGQAGAFGFAPNQIAGKFSIAVKATIGNRVGHGVVHQTNSLEAIASTVEKKKSRWKKWGLIGGLAGGALVATLLATRSGTPAPPAPPVVVLRPGPVTVGGPR